MDVSDAHSPTLKSRRYQSAPVAPVVVALAAEDGHGPIALTRNTNELVDALKVLGAGTLALIVDRVLTRIVQPAVCRAAS